MYETFWSQLHQNVIFVMNIGMYCNKENWHLVRICLVAGDLNVKRGKKYINRCNIPIILKYHFLIGCRDLYFKVHWYRNIFLIISNQGMIRKIKQWCSTISPIPRKQAIKPHQNSLNIKKATRYEGENLSRGLREAHKCKGVKPVMWF